MKKVFMALLIIYIILNVGNISAQSKILINEFLIDPLPQQVEIINTSTQEADISGWYIDDSGGATYYTIPQSSVLSPGACMVFSSDFNFNKSSTDTVRLFDNSSPPTSANPFLVDSFGYKASSGSGISFFRFPDGGSDWATGSASFGLFNSSKLSCILTPTTTPTLTITQTPVTPIPTTISPTTTVHYDKMLISEAMVNPVSGQKEWVEIFNNNDFSVTLSNWYLDDVEDSGSSAKNFTLEIPSFSYRAVVITASMFNNDGDIIRLLDQDKNQVDSFEYQDSTAGKSYGRTDFNSDNFCEQDPSYELQNNSCISTASTLTPNVDQVSNIATETFSKTIIQSKNITPKIVISGMAVNEKINTAPIKNNSGEVLGQSTGNSGTKKSLVKNLSATSFAYSLLTLASILFKMIITYGKGKEFFFASLRS